VASDSAIVASTNHPKLILTLLQRLERPWQVRFARLEEFVRYFDRRGPCRALLELNDRLLADIGLTKYDAGDDALRSCRTRLTMWHVDR
jgi:uncharacterized protein YjiS (DUF1127 family)